jgi:hypothetical protein
MFKAICLAALDAKKIVLSLIKFCERNNSNVSTHETVNRDSTYALEDIILCASASFLKYCKGLVWLGVGHV